MAITVEAKPVTLTWDNFKPVDDVAGDEVAQIHPHAHYPSSNIPVVREGGRVKLGSFKVEVKPVADDTLIERTADKTNELLKHEQGHYDLLILSTRACARELEGARAASGAELGTLVASIQQKHAERAAKVDKAYDDQTRHGRERLIQAQWDLAISTALGNASATRIQNMDL